MTKNNTVRSVLTLDAVSRSIEALHKPFIHEQFLAYLHVRQRGVEAGSMERIEPKWNAVAELLSVPGGPPNKPNYRPFSSRGHDPTRYWLNPNIPGLYAPSSLRTLSRFMLDGSGTGFSLPSDHALKSLAVHLDGKRQPAWPFAGYLLRNFSFDPSVAGPHDLIDAFRQVFRFDSSDRGSDFDVMFTTGNEPDIVWFEPLSPHTSGAEESLFETIEAPVDD